MKAKVGSIQATSASTLLVIIPSAVALDSAFPFKPHEKVMVRIEGEQVIIEKVKGDA